MVEKQRRIQKAAREKKTDVVLTGRYAPKELIERTDFVIEVKDVKHPKEIPTTRGIQY